MQTQLLELKTSNYSLLEDARRKDNEITTLRTRVEELDKELNKSQQLAKLNPLSFAKSFANKKAESKDQALLDQLVAENERLQRKLNQTEEEFQLTNETLRNEVSALMATNSDLLAVNNQLKGLPSDFRQESPSKLSKSESMSNDGENMDIGMSDSSGGKQLSYALLMEKESLNSRVTELNLQLSKMTRELDDVRIAKDAEIRDLERRLAESMTQLSDAQSLAEKRKCLIDEIKVNSDEQTTSHRAALEQLKRDQEREVKTLVAEKATRISELEALILEQRTVNSSLKKDAAELAALRERLMTNEAERKSFREQCELLEQKLKEMEEEHDTRLKHVQVERENAQILMNETHECEVSGLKREISERDETLQELRAEIDKLRTNVKDAVEERKIHEKKGLMMVKELKRQAHQERKRAEKLQERLKQYLDADAPVDLNASSKSNCSMLNDTSSVGSWSYVDQIKNSSKRQGSGSVISDANAASAAGGTDSPCPSSPNNHNDREHNQHNHSNISVANGHALEEEHSLLVEKIAHMQQDKWAAEERINNLEVALSKMSAEMSSKQEIIQFYCMEGRSDVHGHGSPMHHSDKVTVKRVFDFIKDRGDQNAKEINQKLQRMLEETLTKNMHLQRDLERLSDELQRVNVT